MVLKGHTLNYFFSLSMTDKLFCHAAMELAQKRELELAVISGGGRLKP
nr:MAG TPA: hypothetical protein [Caudoviricetes sp.]